jgi:hypothetical protein
VDERDNFATRRYKERILKVRFTPDSLRLKTFEPF